MPTFPAYAKILREGFAEQRESAILRTEMDSGPPRQAKVKSRVLITRPVAILLDTRADYQAFLAWYRDDLNEGAAWFDWTDPVAEAVIAARFTGAALQATPLSTVAGAWRVQAALETWSA